MRRTNDLRWYAGRQNFRRAIPSEEASMSNSSDVLRSWGLTLLRVAVGVIFVAHGGQKFFMGFSNVAGFLGGIGIPYPTGAAILLTAVEFLGGLALIGGVLTRYVAV